MPDPSIMELWAIAGALFGIVFVAVLLHQHFTRPRHEALPAPTDYSVSISGGGGRAGYLSYSDDSGTHEFGWEVGGTNDVVVFIVVPSPEEWVTQLPWASGRRDEVLERIAREVHRQQCRGCGWQITDSDIIMFLRQARA